MNSKVNKLVKLYKQKILDSNIPVEQVILFGSQANGTSGPDSDIDVCVVSSSFGKDRVNEGVELMKLREGISDDIEPHPYSPEEIQNNFDPLVREINKTGIIID